MNDYRVSTKNSLEGDCTVPLSADLFRFFEILHSTIDTDLDFLMGNDLELQFTRL